MTLAEAIRLLHYGEIEGLHRIFDETVPRLWMAASLLSADDAPQTVIDIYRDVLERAVQLRSPSDLRCWLCAMAYPMLLRGDDRPGSRNGQTAEDIFFRMAAALPRDERTALLILCGHGCTAAQAADALSIPAIEIKRSMRRARASMTDLAKSEREFSDAVINTGWLNRQLDGLSASLAQQDAQVIEKIWSCIESGEPYPKQEPVSPDTEQGFFRKLFRSRRSR